MRRFIWLLPVVAVVACKGLLLDNGNAYPCDFAEGPGVRDAVCIAGDVCGTNNVCQKYLYEGPRFEGQATFAQYGRDSGEGAVLHPLVLNGEVSFVTRELPLEAPGGSAYVGLAAGIVEDRAFGHLSSDLVQLPNAPLLVSDKTLVAAQPFSSGAVGLERSVLLWWRSGELSVGTLNRGGAPGLSTLVRNLANAPVSPLGVRVLPMPTATRAVLEGVPVVWTATDLGFLQESANWRYQPVPFDGGAVVDVAGLAQPNQLWLVAMTRDALFIGDVDAGTTRLTDTLAALTPPLVLDHDALRTDRSVRIVAAVRRGLLGPGDPGDVLSTFQVTLGPAGPELVRSWPDCRPCSRGQRLELFAPSISTGFPLVEVACAGVGQSATEALRVVGSVALTQGEGCVTENLDLPLVAARWARDPANRFVQWSSQSGLMLGGKDGQVWTGDTLSDLLPLYLDRVPRDVTTVTLPSGERLLVAITDDSFMVQQTPTSVALGEAVNGFRRLDPEEPLVPRIPRLLSFVRGGEGWAVSANGQVVQAALTDAGPRVTRGPMLVTSSEDPLRDSIGGEAFTTADAGVSLFIAADDSVYFVDPSLLGPLQGEPDLLTPDLTPEPSVPIRSLALERTPLGTDGVTRARGYLVTSRNVYSWQLGGTPRRWSSTPLVLAGGEPVEVWFDQPRSALGRVGYSDGQIYTLPGGYELAEALPENEDGVPPQVIDYENLGGWPVAYANTGVFIAGWDEVNGKLQNRFPDGGINRPMSWRKVTLPDGGRPWMRAREAKPGSLFVKTDAPVPDPDSTDGGTLKPYRLLLFLDDQVIQLASHLRK